MFVLCWSPYFVLNLLQVYDHIPRTQTNIAVASFVQSLAPLNSAANPLIYCLFSTHVCRALRLVVRRAAQRPTASHCVPRPVSGRFYLLPPRPTLVLSFPFLPLVLACAVTRQGRSPSRGLLGD